MMQSARSEDRPGTFRLFFALWPSDPLRTALAAAVEPVLPRVEGQPVPPGNLHVTLAFLGPVSGRLLGALVRVGGQGPWPAVQLDFKRIEYWTKPKVLVAMPEEAPASGQQLVDGLWQELEPLGFERERRPWCPHLTLVRQVRRPPPDGLLMGHLAGPGPEPPWRLALVESSASPDGPRYKPLADWPLQGDVHLDPR